MPELKTSVVHHTSEYRGDHAADIEIHVDFSPDTTLRELGEYLANNAEDRRKWMGGNDWISVHLLLNPKEPDHA